MDPYRENPEPPVNYITANDDIVFFLDEIVGLEHLEGTETHSVLYRLKGTSSGITKFYYKTEKEARDTIRSIMEAKRAWELYKTRGFIEGE